MEDSDLDLDLDLERFTRTPPLPVRNPNHRYSHWRTTLVAPNSSAKIAPKPCSSKPRTALPPTRIYVQVHSIPARSPSPQPSGPSPTASLTSFASYASTVSGPNSIPERSTSQSFSFPPSDIWDWGNEWKPSHAPRPRLRRTKTPKKETLRDLRAKASDLCLQRVYEHQLELYLNGALYPRTRWKDDPGYLEGE